MDKVKLTKALWKYHRENSCNGCPDFRTGKPRLTVKSDCKCVGLEAKIKEQAEFIIEILGVYRETE